MAKLYLKYETNTLKELPVSQAGIVTIGRLPDNVLQIDNLAVSGHHAKVYWESDHYTVEDNKSLNGTYVNNQRVAKVTLKDGDTILIGKHTVVFKDEWHEDAREVRHAAAHTPLVPKIDSTVVLDTKKAREMMAQAKAAAAGQSPATAAAASGSGTERTPAPGKEIVGTLTVLEGKTDSSQYTLNSKMSVIGKSAMASIKLKGSFFKSPPDVAAIINKRDSRYFIAPQDKKAHVSVNGVQVEHQQELAEGDIVEVAGVKMTFGMSG